MFRFLQKLSSLPRTLFPTPHWSPPSISCEKLPWAPPIRFSLLLRSAKVFGPPLPYYSWQWSVSACLSISPTGHKEGTKLPRRVHHFIPTGLLTVSGIYSAPTKSVMADFLKMNRGAQRKARESSVGWRGSASKMGSTWEFLLKKDPWSNFLLEA